MKLFWCPKTRAVRALWMLEEIGVDYEIVRTDVRAEVDPNRDDLLKASPMGKVPALVDGEAMFSESAAICLYLADKYASGTLAPKLDDPARGSFLYWMMYVPGVIEPAMAEKFQGMEPSKLSHGWGDFPSMIKTLEEALDGNDWLVNNSFSAADVMVGSTCYFINMFNILPESEIIDGYISRCVARPANVKALAIDAEG